MEEEGKPDSIKVVSVEKVSDIPLSIGKINLNPGHTTMLKIEAPQLNKPGYFTIYKVAGEQFPFASFDLETYSKSSNAKNEKNNDFVISLVAGEISNNQQSVIIYTDMYSGSDEETQKNQWDRMFPLAKKVFHDARTFNNFIKEVEKNNLPYNSNSHNFKHLVEITKNIPEISREDSKENIEEKATRWLQGEIDKRKY